MAVVVRHGVALLMVLVAVAFVASATAQSSDWDSYITNEQVRQDNVRSQSVETEDVTTDSSGAAVKGYTIVVDSNGKGNYKTIQAAINSVTNGNKERVIIKINDGVYRQKILVPSKKPNIYFKCQSRRTIITWGDTAEKAGSTSLSASVAIEADGFIASDCTFVNSAPAPNGGAVGQQAVALRIQGDQGAFYRCGFLGAQDTLYDKVGRHFFRSCEIVGSIDWIFGNGQSFYQYCKLTSIAMANSGSVTAQNRLSSSQDTGFVFFQCSIGGSGSIYLGRAWGIYSRVIFYQCNIANMITPVGWFNWGDPKREKTVFYAEYKCSGPGANRAGRVPWSKELTDKQAAPFGSVAFIDGKQWLLPAM